jgi:hypothetical protein
VVRTSANSSVLARSVSASVLSTLFRAVSRSTSPASSSGKSRFASSKAWPADAAAALPVTAAISFLFCAAGLLSSIASP